MYLYIYTYEKQIFFFLIIVLKFDQRMNMINYYVYQMNILTNYQLIFVHVVDFHFDMNKQNNIKHVYYRGLQLSDTEIRYYLDKQMECYYTNSFSSFTIDRLLIYPGNAVLILKVEDSGEKARKNLANIWKWSTFGEEKEALLAVGTKLKVLSVHFYGGKWQIELELMEDNQGT